MSDDERGRFLKVLRETGNRCAAAAAIGVEPRLMDQRRQHDGALDREWAAAVDAAHAHLSEAKGPFGCAPLGRLNMIRRGKNGRLQLVATGEGRWSAEVEERFAAVLRATGNVRAAAHSVGFAESTIWQRRRRWPAFAQMLDETLEEAELVLEFRIAAMGSNVVGEASDGGNSDGPSPPRTFHRSNEIDGAAKSAPPGHFLDGRGEVPFDLDSAMRFLKWREEKRRGRARRTPLAKPPSIEEVTETIVRRVEAIKRHRRRESGE
ncbi:MAG: hypothetical protein ACJ8E3_09605 [Sphingomicrobium sp.]